MALHRGSNLPAEVTSFVGRGAEVSTARKLLAGSRILTVIGPGGVGKTRLSRQVGRTVTRAFPDGVWIVELADVGSGDLVALSVAQALSLQDDSATPIDGLIEFLADKRLLLVLDNCEHLIDDCAALVNRLVAATSEVRVLATSREILGVPGEQVMPLAPLPVPPDEDHDSPAPDSDALRLLVERATAANPGFVVTEANRATLAAICRRLAGIPLALELAALRLRTYSPDHVLRRLDDSMRLLTVGPRTAPGRQQTLEAAIGWSYDLCSPAEQRLWERLSVFSGGFDVDAVEAVCLEADALAGLVDKSVLSLRLDTADGVARYTILEPLRQFSHSRLVAAGGEREVRLRHRDHYQRLAERGRVSSYDSDDVAWFAEVTREHANLRAAMQFSLEDGPDQPHACEIAADLRPFWEHYRFVLEGYRWLSRALAGHTARTAERARALSACGYIAEMLSDPDIATQLTAESVEIAAELGITDLLAEATLHSALLAFTADDPAGALVLAESAAAQCRASRHHGVEMESLAFAAVVAMIIDDPQTADIAERFLTVATNHGSHLMGGLALWTVGVSQWRAGDHEKAGEFLRQAIEQFTLFDRCVWIASGFEGLAWSAGATGDNARAARLLGASSAIRLRSTLRLAHNMTDVVGAASVKRVRDALGDAAFTVAFDAGVAMSLDHAVDYALDRAAADPPVSAVPATEVLTRREKDVARLVAAGHSNKGIAAELVISVRTAETHVEHILTKLDAHSRTQIAAWVNENGV